MAKASWCTTDPSTGSGDGTVNVGASAHTGRNQRTTALTFKATGVTDQAVAVTQLAKGEFVTMGNISAPAAGGVVTLTGKTNSSKLTFALGAGTIVLTLPGTYSAGGASTANGAAITGDPGAVEEFNFSIQFTVPENLTSGTLTRIVTVTANGGMSASATISQSAGSPFVTVSPNTITLEASGATQTVNVSSNTNWTVS